MHESGLANKHNAGRINRAVSFFSFILTDVQNIKLKMYWVEIVRE